MDGVLVRMFAVYSSFKLTWQLISFATQAPANADRLPLSMLDNGMRTCVHNTCDFNGRMHHCLHEP
jgi:hypothetical protein